MKTHIGSLLSGAAVAALLCIGARAHESKSHGAHEHGVARLNVAVDGGRVEIELHSPAVNVVGFERAPRSDAERKAAAQALATLRDGARLFVLPPAAHCRLLDAEVRAPEWSKEASGHADYEARYAFDCHDAAALDSIRVDLVNELREGTTVRVQLIGVAAPQAASLKRGSTLLRLR